MTTIWRRDGEHWSVATPKGFAQEAALHDLVEEAPQLLPLSGSPRLVVLGREVQVGTGYADLVAIEPSGRVVVVEVKLASNSEARRAVVTQVLTYASYLHGLSADDFENLIGRHLRSPWSTIAEAVGANDEEGSFDAADFSDGLAESLGSGRFRLVIVLDDAPPELVRLVGYLEAVTESLVIDLIAVSSYVIEGTQILVPQRVDPERVPPLEPGSRKRSKSQAPQLVAGPEGFIEGIAASDPTMRPMLERLVQWVGDIERECGIRVESAIGVDGRRRTLLPRLRPDNAGLVTIWNDNGPYIQFWRSVFERRAPQTLARLEASLGDEVRQGNTTGDITDELLDLVADAYREAVGAVETS